MKWLKICALLVLTLSAMRAASWVLGWTLARITPLRRGAIAVSSNLGAFGAFWFLLWWNSYPGEPLDFAPLLFGLFTFGLYYLLDVYRHGWKDP
jgi:hypothetical protein